ncbi:MAG TPA: TatD family hydrolase [Thermoleophilia bacterium]|nr:TatD family hydrolase [Thermoleophilia bacterium]
MDTHCHLDLLEDTEADLAAARAAGIEAVVAVGFDLESSCRAVAFAQRCAPVAAAGERASVTPARELSPAASAREPALAASASARPCVFACVGLHPHDAQTLDDAMLAQLEELAAAPGVVAIGECGLDYYRERSPRDAQRRAFSAQIALARRTGLTLVVHTREAAGDTMAMLDEEAAGLTVVLHCFSLPDHVDAANERGYYQSFAGNVTYKNAADLRAAAARVRDDLLLVETDAPYLSPVPYRGKPNRPAWVVETAAVVAEARGWTSQRTAAVTTANARRAFCLPTSD